MPLILGIGGSDHDVHACLVRDDVVLFSVEEERISRRKYGLGGNLLEGLARNYCLAAAGIDLDAVDEVVVDSILPPTAYLGCRSRARRLDHHLAHSASSYFTSGFDSAAVLVIDNAGDLVRENGEPALQATSWYRAHGRSIELAGRVTSSNWHEGRKLMGAPYQRGDGDHSLGHLYKKFTGALGFRHNGGSSDKASDFYFPEDGITMGLASFGDQRYVDPVWSLVELREKGQYRLPLNDGRLDAMLATWLRDQSFENRAAVAAAVQEVLTRILLHLVENALDVTGETRLCLAGGVAMNSVANGVLRSKSSALEIHVPPVPGDNGTGLGAALWAATRQSNARVPRYGPYGGRRYSDQEVRAALEALDVDQYAVCEPSERELIEAVALSLTKGRIVAWFEGGSEHGRRALGHRSLLCDPRSVELRDHLNRIKGRAAFRPVAPVVPLEFASHYFDTARESAHMQFVVGVRGAMRSRLAGVTHVDGTARIQTVTREQHTRLHALLLEFGRLGGVPVLSNTSFNLAGEPLVETPVEAVSCFRSRQIDMLVLEDKLVTRVR